MIQVSQSTINDLRGLLSDCRKELRDLRYSEEWKTRGGMDREDGLRFNIVALERVIRMCEVKE